MNKDITFKELERHLENALDKVAERDEEKMKDLPYFLNGAISNETERLKDRIDNICSLVDLELSGQITRSELIRRLTDIVKKEKKPKRIKVDDIEGCYYVEDDTLIYSCDDYADDVQVSDLTELKVWQYNVLVRALNKQYPDYKIKLLTGRFI